MRFYLDTNILRYIKPGSNFGHQENLEKTINGLKELNIFPYSDAHLEDLSASNDWQKTLEDLNQLGALSDGVYYKTNSKMSFKLK